MNFFVNLPLSWVHRDQIWLERLLDGSAKAAPGREFGPEFGFDDISLDLPPAWHRDIAARVRDRGLKSSVHLPFFMPPPGAPARAERERSREILCKAAELALLYEAEHLIGHPMFDPTAPFPAAQADTNAAGWAERSMPAWLAVTRVNPAPLYLENTYEQGPAAIVGLLEALRPITGPAGAAFCFDVGHWFSFAGGARLGNLEAWLDLIAPVLGHLHLHDNDGDGDQHIGLGRGGIPLEKCLTALAGRGLAYGFTLEPHDLESFFVSLAWLERSPAMRARLRPGRFN